MKSLSIMFLLYFWRASLYYRWRLPDERCRDIATTTTWTKGGEGNKDVVGGTKGDGIQWKNCNKCILGHGKRSLNVESRLVSFRTLSLRETFLMKITRKSVNILNFFQRVGGMSRESMTTIKIIIIIIVVTDQPHQPQFRFSSLP